MKIPSQLIESCVARQETKYTLQAVLLDVDRKLLVATDGHALAAIPAEPDKGDVTGLISLRGWKLLRTLARRIPKTMRGKVFATAQVLKHKVVLRGHDETTVIPKPTGGFPEWSGLFSQTNPVAHVTVNVDILYSLSQALCDPSKPPLLKILIEGPDKIVAVLPMYGNGVGLLMPVRPNDSTGLHERCKDLGIEIKKKVSAAS